MGEVDEEPVEEEQNGPSNSNNRNSHGDTQNHHNHTTHALDPRTSSKLVETNTTDTDIDTTTTTSADGDDVIVNMNTLIQTSPQKKKKHKKQQVNKVKITRASSDKSVKKGRRRSTFLRRLSHIGDVSKVQVEIT